MSINYRLRKCNIKHSENYGKLYAYAVRTDVADQRELERRIQQNCTAKPSDVRVVLRELVEVMRECLQEGRTVRLDEFGSFALTIKSRCVNEAADFDEKRDIRGFRCKFTPYGERFGDGSHNIRRPFTADCTVHRLDDYHPGDNR